MTGMKRYIEKPRQLSAYYAAQYQPGRSLDDVLAVARKMHRDAAVVEVPELEVLVVRYLRVPDDHPARIEYEVVEAGHFLVYSETFDVLYSSSPKEFERDHEDA